MLLRLILESFLRQRRRKLLACAAILLGATAVTAMLAIGTSVGDKMNRELSQISLCIRLRTRWTCG
jgi:putative ABC transport system permease protein